MEQTRLAKSKQASRRIWSPKTSQSFYRTLYLLHERVGNRRSPREPADYRVVNQRSLEDAAYLLSLEEEQHLADHFAFLAHAEEGVEYVTAATLEESIEPVSLTVRLASNHTPTPYVVGGLSKILRIVEEHANQGRRHQESKDKLFHEIINYSQKRIHARTRSCMWKKPAYFHQGKDIGPLYARIQLNLLKSIPTGKFSKNSEVESIRNGLSTLVELLKSINNTTQSSQVDVLKHIVQQSYTISRQGAGKSLERRLQGLNLSQSVTEGREVLEIDKLSKYLEICDDLIRASGKPKTRDLFRNLKLEVCESYPGAQPPGASASCFVHGEVQLVLFYETAKNLKRPRAIGSSKSACFLCDLFIRKHGGFGMSHAHMKLYPKWRIPEILTWADQQQIQRFRGIMKAMELEMRSLLKLKFYHTNTVMESRAHILQIATSSLASSVAGTVKPGELTVGSPSPPESVQGREFFVSRLYYFQDLPIELMITSATTSCILLAGQTDYIFDVTDIEYGQLMIEHVDSKVTIENSRFDVRELSQQVAEKLQTQAGARFLSFTVHDSGNHELLITLKWTDPE